jgi:hypothetical protein
MSHEISRVELIGHKYDPTIQTSEHKTDNLYELFPKSYMELSKNIRDGISTRIISHRLVEKERRTEFTEAIKFIEYPDSEDDYVKLEEGVDAYDASEAAWENISRLTFSDGSSLSGEAIRFANETGPPSQDVVGEIRSIFDKIDNRFTDTAEAKDEYVDPETYREQLRKKYEEEAARYRLELEELANLDASGEPVPVKVESFEFPPSQKVLEEIGEIMFRIEMNEIEEEEIDLAFMESLALIALSKQKKS